MTPSTDTERAAFEAIASDDGKWPTAIERDAKGNYLLLTTANGWMWWQAARRAPAAQEPAPLTDERIRQLDDETHFHESHDWSVRFARRVEAEVNRKPAP